MTRRRIYLMRHGEVTYFVDGRPVKPTETQLTDRGRRETRMTAEAFTAGISRLRARAAQEEATANQEREDSHRLWQYALLLMMLTLAAEGILGRRVA